MSKNQKQVCMLYGKYRHLTKALDETISNICFLFNKKQVKIQFLRKNDFLGFQP